MYTIGHEHVLGGISKETLDLAIALAKSIEADEEKLKAIKEKQKVSWGKYCMNYNTFNDLFVELINQENYDFWENAEKMNIFPKKHVCFLISDQHLIPHGVIGKLCKSFI